MDDDKFFTRAIVAIWIAGATISLAMTGFAVWVIVKLLQHFGVI